MNDYTKQKIINDIKAENDARVILNTEGPRVCKIINEYLGRKVQNKDGTTIKALKDKITLGPYTVAPRHPGDHVSTHAFMTLNNYSLYIDLTICYNGGSYDDRTYYCEYKQFSRYVGNIRDGVLESLYEQKEQPPIDINAELMQAEKVEALREELKKEEEKLHYTTRKNL
jgi:hypothetical protein